MVLQHLRSVDLHDYDLFILHTQNVKNRMWLEIQSLSQPTVRTYSNRPLYFIFMFLSAISTETKKRKRLKFG